jgi:hypothetical protein
MKDRIRYALVGSTALVALCVAAIGGTAQGAEAGSYQTARFVFDQTKPNKSTGTTFDVDYHNPSDPQGKPPAVRRVILEAAPGARFDTSVPDRCTANDAQLMLMGAQACPTGSRVGTGETTVDTGFPGSGRFIKAHIDFFNNTNELIFLNTEEGTGARTVIRAKVEERRIITDAPVLPGTPPDGGAIDTAHTHDPAYSAGQRAYLTTPAVCPPSGKWTNSMSFTYADGVTQTVSSPTSCEPTKPTKQCKRKKKAKKKKGGAKKSHEQPSASAKKKKGKKCGRGKKKRGGRR